MTTVHAVLPDGIDDPTRPTGGNVYDRHMCRGLVSLGWSVHEHAVPGFWDRPDATSFAALTGVVERIPDDAVVLLDGLIASTAPEVLVPEARRLRLVVLVHMPLGHRLADGGTGDARTRERAVLSAAAGVVTTSAWTRRRLLELYPLPAERMHVAPPGVDAAGAATGTADGGALLCVAAVSYAKGHDVLADALASLRDLPWDCVCVGRLDRDPAFVESLRRRLLDDGDQRARPPPGTAHRGRAGPQLRRRGPDGAGVPFRDLRHGRRRGAGPRGSGRRHRGRRGDGGTRSRRKSRPARAARRAG